MKISSATISEIAIKSLGVTPTSILPLKGGDWSNVYKIETSKGDFCIKLENIYQDRSIMKMEQNVMSKLQKNLHVPEPIAYGKVTSAEVEYLIMEFVGGDLLSNVWEGKTSKEKQELIDQMLDMINQIKNVSTTGFGPVDENLKGKYKTMAEYLDNELNNFEKSEARGLVNKNEVESSKEIFNEYSRLQTNNPKLVHADFRLRNIILGDHLYLFDFTNALSFNPTFDFVRFLDLDLSSDENMRDYAENKYTDTIYTGKNYEIDKNVIKLLLKYRLLPWFVSRKKVKYTNRYAKNISEINKALKKQLF